jgi:hypothetical protein
MLRHELFFIRLHQQESTMLRRSLLKSLPMGVVAPYLAPLVARAESEAQGKTPKRFVFFVEGNGLPPDDIQPVGIVRKDMPNPKGGQTGKCNGEDAIVDLRLSDPGHSLPAPIAPLARHTKRLTLLQGLSGRVCGGGHSNGFGSLGAYSASAGAKDVTIDAAIAKAIPAIFQHLALGMKGGAEPIFYCCSASGPNQKVPHYQDPVLAYNMLFGKILGGNTEAEVGAQAMLLDHMADDIKRVESQLPKTEAEKLGQFADAFSSINRRQSRLKEIDAKKIPPKRDEVYASTIETKQLEAHFEIAATALITGMTNTVTLTSGATSYPVWSGLGISIDNHTIGHMYNERPKEGQSVSEGKAMAIKIRQYNMELLAKLVDKLEAMPEGNGSMMDNTVILYLSDSAENHHSSCFDWPMVMIGNLGGRLKPNDRFLNFAKYGAKGHATIGMLYTTLLHAAGAPVDHFGIKDTSLIGAIEQAGPLKELLA